jgi:hypothetical protein
METEKPQEVEVNKDLINSLRTALAQAERGQILDGVFCGMGNGCYVQSFNVRHPQDMSGMIFEVDMLSLTMKGVVSQQRQKMMEAQMRPGIILPRQHGPGVAMTMPGLDPTRR